MLSVDIVEIDISPLLKWFGRIIVDLPIEIELVKLYKRYHYGKDDTISKFTNMVLKQIYKDNVDRDYGNINTFYNEGDYLTFIYTFIDFNTVLINRNIDPDYINVEFDSIVKNTDDTLIVKYKVYKGDKNGRSNTN